MSRPVTDESDRRDLTERGKERICCCRHVDRRGGFEHAGQLLLMGEIRTSWQREVLATVVGDAEPGLLPLQVIQATDAQVVDRGAGLRGVAEEDQVEPARPKVALPSGGLARP